MRKGMLMDQSVCIDVTLAGELSIGAPQMWQKRDRSWSERISIHRKVYKITSCFFSSFPKQEPACSANAQEQVRQNNFGSSVAVHSMST